MPTISSLLAVTIDCADGAALARFSADVLGRQVAGASTSWQAVLFASLAGGLVEQGAIMVARDHQDGQA
jgi:hypothetical protein